MIMIIVIILEFRNTETKCSEGENISLVICHHNQDPTSIQTQFQLSHSKNTPTHSRNRITALMNYPTQHTLSVLLPYIQQVSKYHILYWKSHEKQCEAAITNSAHKLIKIQTCLTRPQFEFMLVGTMFFPIVYWPFFFKINHRPKNLAVIV